MAACRIRSRGFTLIELLVVMAIIGVLVLVGMPRIGNNYTNAVLGVVNQVEGTLYAAQRSATTTLTMVTVSATGTWAGQNYLLTFTGAAPQDAFRYTPQQADHIRAGIDPGVAGWPSELGTRPFAASTNVDASVVNAATARPLGQLTGASVQINAVRKEFSEPFFIAVVPYRNGAPLYSGPAGVVVVQGHRIFKYIRNSKTEAWRRA